MVDRNVEGGARRKWWWSVLIGLCSIIFGLLVLSYEVLGLFALIYFACAYFLVWGFAELAGGYSFGHHRWWNVTVGILSIGAGITGLVWPGVTLFVIAVLIGWMILGWGLADIANAFAYRHLRFWWGYLVRGLFAIVVALIAIRDPGSAVLALVLVLGIWSIFNGVVELTTGLDLYHSR